MLTKDPSNGYDRPVRRTRGRFRVASASAVALSTFFSLTLGGVLPAHAMPADGSHAPFEQKYSAGAGESGPTYQESYENEDAFQHYEAAVLQSVNEYWKKQFAAWERPLSPAGYLLVGSGRTVPSNCGDGGTTAGDPAQFPGANPSFYCRQDQPPTIYVSAPWMMREIYRPFGYKAVSVILAHEYSHHIQHEVGIESSDATAAGSRSRKSFELQADCLAGDWAGYYPGYVTQQDEPHITAAWAKLGSDSKSETGYASGQERVDWFWHGFNDGIPKNCDPPQ